MVILTLGLTVLMLIKRYRAKQLERNRNDVQVWFNSKAELSGGNKATALPPELAAEWQSRPLSELDAAGVRT